MNQLPSRTQSARADEPGRNTPRYSSPTRLVEGRQVIDVRNYVPYFFAAINNALSRGASQKYLDEFGIGIVEWRIVSMLGIEPRITATRICEVVLLDKSSTSRGLRSLQDKGFLNYLEAELDARRRIWWLNEDGHALHDGVLKIALDRERKLLQGVDAADLEIALRVMRQMRENLLNLES
jgi:DNA-binding MarR family transcriptional regulator